MRALLILLASTPCLADSYDLRKHDQQLHLAGSIFGAIVLGSAAAGLTNDRVLGPMIGGFTMLAVGMAWESRKPGPDKGDFAADAVGCGLGTSFNLIVWRF